MMKHTDIKAKTYPVAVSTEALVDNFIGSSAVDDYDAEYNKIVALIENHLSGDFTWVADANEVIAPVDYDGDAAEEIKAAADDAYDDYINGADVDD